MPVEPKVSIIIPSYNRAAYTVEAANSALNQTYRNFEIIVVDDGSTDNTKQTLEPYLGDNRVRYLYQQNAGPSSARNLGIKHAQGEYVAFLDSDDLWLPGKLSFQVDFVKHHPELEVAYCDLVFFNKEGVLNNYLDKNSGRAQGRIFEECLLLKTSIFLSCLMVKKSVLDDVGLFNESLYTAEDTNLILRIAKKYSFGYLDKILVKRRIHDNNLSLIGVENIGTIKSLDLLIRLYPELHPSRSRLMRKAYEYRYERIGYSHFHRNDYLKARDCYSRALRFNCIDFKNMMFLCLCYIPANWVTGLRNARRRLLSSNKAKEL